MVKKFTQQLRDFDDADLTVYQFRLMMHYWRRGYCWEPLRTTAKICNMSLGKASEARKWLLENGWIQWEVDPKSNKMSIVMRSPHEQTQQLERSPDEQCSPHEQERSPHEQNTVEDVHHMNTYNKVVNEPQELNEPNRNVIDSIPFKPVKQKSKHPPSPADERVAAILAVCGLDESVPAHLRQAQNAAAQLSRYTAADILRRYQRTENPNGTWYWYRDDWRGKQGQQPAPAQVVECIGKKMMAGQGQKGRVVPAPDEERIPGAW